jgi:hypothetical protein
MADVKISQVTAKGAALEDDDILLIGEYNGSTYDSKSVTGANVRPFKTILFALSQSGTGAPTKDYSYEAEVSQTFTLARASAGIYTLTASSALFTANKTFLQFSLGGNGTNALIAGYVSSTTFVTFYTTDSTTGAYTDSLLDFAQLEIKIIK